MTYRQLDYWVRTGVISPVSLPGGNGGRRRWSMDDVRRVSVVARLMHWRAPMPIVNRLARRVTEEMVDMPAEGGWLVVGADGSVTWAGDGRELAEACGRNGPGCWVLDLAALAGGAVDGAA